MSSKILICGATSFVAKGFYELLKDSGYEVETFSRGGAPSREGGKVKGVYTEIDKNQELAEQYDAVVNFAVLKDQSPEDNVRYAEALVRMCREHGVKKLIHFSSIMVYSHHVGVVNEKAQIERSEDTTMKGYGMLKIKVDEYLMSQREKVPFEIVLVRPGFVLAPGMASPFIKHLAGPVSVILGNKDSRMPIVRREDIHQALVRIIETERNLPVYMFYPNDDMTKYRYAKKSVGGMILTFPKWLFCGIPSIMTKMHIMPQSLFSRFEGMFNENRFESVETEKKLNFKFQ